jgi:luciferase family oxidoreductase group 1
VTSVPLSVLDLAPVPAGSTSRQALADTVALAQQVERLGYGRFWVAEHHGMPGVASSAPAVLIGAVAAATSTIRVGSGGVMLPNHAPLVVAEQFGTLEALHPGRIDLGLGRAPGTDPATASALRRGASADDFPQELLALRSFFSGDWSAGHPWSSLQAVPALGNGPAIWLLGSSGYSAQLAGLLGLPFSFAHHFAPQGTLQALELYRSASARRRCSASRTPWSARRSCSPTPTSGRASWPCRARCRSCGCAAAGPDCCRRSRRRCPTTTRRTSWPSSSSAWRSRASAPRDRARLARAAARRHRRRRAHGHDDGARPGRPAGVLHPARRAAARSRGTTGRVLTLSRSTP